MKIHHRMPFYQNSYRIQSCETVHFFAVASADSRKIRSDLELRKDAIEDSATMTPGAVSEMSPPTQHSGYSNLGDSQYSELPRTSGLERGVLPCGENSLWIER